MLAESGLSRKKRQNSRKRTQEEIDEALRSSFRSLRRNMDAYDEGDFLVSRELANIVHRIAFDELRAMQLYRSLKFADCRRIRDEERRTYFFPDRPPMNTERTGFYNPFVGTGMNIETGELDYSLKVYPDELDIVEAIKEPSETYVIGLFQPRLVWVSFEKWRNGNVFAEAATSFRTRKLQDATSKRKIISRQKAISAVRNERGAHFDVLVSEELDTLETDHSEWNVTVSGRAEPYQNNPSDCIIRALAGELYVTLINFGLDKST